MTSENLNLLIGAGQLLFALLLFLGIDRKFVVERIPNIRIRSAWLLVLIFGGLAFSGYGFYIANKRPKEITKVVEKPVEKIVEKLITKECPKLAPSKAGKALVIPPGTTIQGTTNAPDSMAAGINTGTMIKGDAPPTFKLSKISANVPDGNVYKTVFELAVSTKHGLLLHLKATSPSLTGPIMVEKKVPPQENDGDGGMMLEDMGPATNGVATVKVPNLDSGTYIIKVSSTKPDNILVTYE